MSPGFERGVGGSVPFLHFGNEPHFGTKHRYIWVIDGLPPGSRQRQFLQLVVNVFNSVASGNRPYFLYYTAEQAGGGDWTSCNRPPVTQVIKFCSVAGQYQSYASIWFDDWTSHVQYGTAAIGALAPWAGDVYNWNSVAHEFGHLLGFAHDTDCGSVMTYCGTISTNYLWFGRDQGTVYQYLYDRHPDG